MHWLDQEISDKVQFIAFFLTLIGISFIIMDIYFPKAMDAVEESIDKCEDKAREFYFLLTKKKRFDNIFTAICIIGFFFIMPYYAGVYDLYLGEQAQSLKFIVAIFLVLFGIMTLTISMIFLEKFIIFLNDFSNGKAYISLGILISLMGFILEIYQILVYLYGN